MAPRDPKNSKEGSLQEQPLRIGTRSSRLARWQAEHVQGLLADRGYESELVEIATQGDRNRSSAFSQMSGSGFFTKAIEEALLAGEVDVAVHSHKDLETTPTPGTRIAAIPERADPSDLLLVHPEHSQADPLLPIANGGTVGSSSPRRQEQVRMFRPDLNVQELRGNVPTRLQKLRDQQYSAILIARAGIERMGIDTSELHSYKLPPDRFISAPAQGALAVQVRSEDTKAEEILQKLHHPPSGIPCRIEREILKRFRGGCQLPLGAYCQEEEAHYRVRSMVLLEGKSVPKRLEMKFSKEEGDIPDRVAARLKKEQEGHILITRSLPTEHWWVRCMEANGMEVTAVSLIDQESLPTPELPFRDLILFTSRNGVHFFLEHYGKTAIDRPIAAFGTGSAEALAREGLTADFIGNGGPKETGRSLLAWMKEQGHKELLIPGPEEPAGNVQGILKEGRIRVHEVPLYRSYPKTDLELPTALQGIIFTSPSNVRAYLQAGRGIDHEEVFAIGPTTASALEEHFPGTSVHTPSNSNLLGLLDLYFGKERET